MDSLSELIRTRRLALGMKQTTLAYRAGVSQGAISDIEKGRRVNLTRDLLERLATALDLPVSDLLVTQGDGDPPMVRLPEDVPPAFASAFLAASRFLSPRQQESVLRFVQSLAAEVADAEQDAATARRDLDTTRAEQAGPVKGNGQRA